MTKRLPAIAGGRTRRMAVIDTVRSILETKGRQVWHITPSATVYEAVAEMAKRGVGALPVLTRNRLVGMISERDYARKVILEGRASRETLVRDIMTPAPISVSPGDTLDHCLRLMTQRRIRHLPVVEHKRVVGILSIGDLVKAVIDTQAFTIDQLQTYIVAGYPS